MAEMRPLSYFLIKWLGIWDTIETDYDTQLSAPTRAYIGSLCPMASITTQRCIPNKPNRNIFPINGKDIVAGYMLRHLLFYGFDCGTYRDLCRGAPAQY